MDHYLVSVFQNQGLNAVRTLCDQGKQKLSLRNQTLLWAIQNQENELAEILIPRSNVHFDDAMPVRIAAMLGNTEVLEKLLAVPDQGGSAVSRFYVYADLVNNPSVSSKVLNLINTSFSDDVFKQLYEKGHVRVEDYARMAQWQFECQQERYQNTIRNAGDDNHSKPNLKDVKFYQLSVQLQSNLEKMLQLRAPVKKATM